MNWWRPDIYQRKIPYLQGRSRVLSAIRGYFDAQDFMEVETPILQICPTSDTHIHGFRTEIQSADRQNRADMYLHTSPEFAMKKLLVAGLPKIFQICHVFRNAEGSHRHSPEFTMVEWYRANERYGMIMQDCIALLRHVAYTMKIDRFRFRGAESDPFAEWELITVVDAFRKYAGLDIEPFLPPPGVLTPPRDGVDGFYAAVKAMGIHCTPDDTWDDLFFRVMMEKIEPNLGMGRPCILHEYPVSMAALAQACPHDPRFAERFEMYVCGIELANAFGELTDPAIQRARFNAELDLKAELYGERYPVDEDFLKALEHGMPPASGIALGIDRLVMLTTGADDIADVMWAPVMAGG